MLMILKMCACSLFGLKHLVESKSPICDLCFQAHRQNCRGVNRRR